MNGMRKVLGFLMVLMLAAFTLPAIAADKTFKIDVVPATASTTPQIPTGPSTMTVTFTNTGTSSNFNSIILGWSAPRGNFTVSRAYNSQSGPSKSVNIANGQTSVTFTNLSPVKPGNPITVTLVVNATPLCGESTVTWTSQAFTGSPTSPSVVFTGNPGTATTYLPVNTVVGACIDCVTQPNGKPDTFSGASSIDSTTVSGNRGANKDGSVCKVTAFSLTFLNGREFKFAWDTTSQPSAAFSYVAKFAPTSVEASTGLPAPLLVAWKLKPVTPDNPNPGPDYVLGRACLSSSLPAAYGILYADSGSTIKVTLNATPAPPSGNFDVVIGADRLTVQTIDTLGTWSVIARNVGVSPVATPAPGPNVKVMSTPFPLDGSGKVMPMCTADYTYIVGDGILPVANPVPVGKVSVEATIFDQGDGWVDQP